MIQIQRRCCAGWLLCVLVLLASGCRQRASAPAPVPVVHRAELTSSQSNEPSEIELFDPKMTLLEPDRLVQFEVKYRFTKGQPNKYYGCNVKFPETGDFGIKRMHTWEMKSEGVIRDKFRLNKPGAKTFEAQVGETSSPQSIDYKKISNVVSGSIQ